MNTEEPEPKEEVDDLEEGELMDDDDDDDEIEAKAEGEEPKSNAEDPSSSSSSSAVSSPASSKSSPKDVEAQVGSSKSYLSYSRPSSGERYRSGRDKDRHDATSKAAKLISMRTALLEARSREIEMKFQKNKTKVTQPPTTQQQLTLLVPPPAPAHSNLKMTITQPSISYGENPNPPKAPSTSEEERDQDSKKSVSKREPKEKKSKKKFKKKRKKSSSRKHKKHKSESAGKKSVSGDSKSGDPTDIELPYDSVDHQGPRTPPDNHVTTLENEQIEWPSHLIRMTTTQPSISYSVNPDSVMEPSHNDRAAGISSFRRRKSSASSPLSRIKMDDGRTPVSGSPSQSAMSPAFGQRRLSGLHKDYTSTVTNVQENIINTDFNWYYNYFINSFEMDHNQAQQQSYAAILSVNSYEPEALETWLNQRGLTKQIAEPDTKQAEDAKSTPLSESDTNSSIKTVVTRINRNQVNRDIDDCVLEVKQEPGVVKEEPATINNDATLTLCPVKPKITVLKSDKEIVLPNGQTLPPGTIQRIVHPYPRPDSDALGSLFDMH